MSSRSRSPRSYLDRRRTAWGARGGSVERSTVSRGWFPFAGVARFNVIERRLERFLQEPASVRNAVGVIVVATILVVVGGGVLIRLLDPDEYADIWTGMWWSLQTVTTVGYGDVTPGHFSGRLVGAVVMLEGTAFIAIITAAITSNFVARATQAYAAAQAEEDDGDVQRLERHLEQLERKLDLLLAARGHPEA